MKTKLYIGAVLAGSLLFIAGHMTARGEGSMNQKTQENLLTAMHGEAFAHAKYLLYAKQARRDGHTELANLFTKAANTELLQHFAEEAQLEGLAGSDADNLKDAIKGESYEVDTMYREFAEQAAAAGDKAAADRFEEIRHDEMAHRDAFKGALAKLETKPSAGQ
ncbi:MAG TPA: rubrerythrin family protein [Candidatus Limnocylindrales bacterium]|nr:rubrerythrin family protein [Candidatus Limnocylindrales bacterium]